MWSHRCKIISSKILTKFPRFIKINKMFFTNAQKWWAGSPWPKLVLPAIVDKRINRACSLETFFHKTMTWRAFNRHRCTPMAREHTSATVVYRHYPSFPSSWSGFDSRRSLKEFFKSKENHLSYLIFLKTFLLSILCIETDWPHVFLIIHPEYRYIFGS